MVYLEKFIEIRISLILGTQNRKKNSDDFSEIIISKFEERKLEIGVRKLFQKKKW